METFSKGCYFLLIQFSEAIAIQSCREGFGHFLIQTVHLVSGVYLCKNWPFLTLRNWPSDVVSVQTVR